jgi:hypothetical protein
MVVAHEFFSPFVHGLICVSKIDHHRDATITLWYVPIVLFPSIHGIILCK